MNEFEQYALRVCMPQLANLQNKSNQDIADKLFAKLRDSCPPAQAQKLQSDIVKFVQRQTLATERVDAIAPAALDMVFENRALLLPQLRVQSPAVTNLITEMLHRHHPHGEELPCADIFANWQTCEILPSALASGIYQIYRRHKPINPVGDEQGHHIVTELVRIDSKAKKCVLIAADGEINYGTIHVNSRGLAFFLYQHRLGGNDFEFRFYCLELEGERDLYSSLCIRVGDVSGRPIMSECLAVYVGRRKHAALYEAVDELGLDEKQGQRIPDNSIIFEYLAPSPTADGRPTRWPIKYVKDFPFFSKIVREKSGSLEVFQEPVKAMNNEDIFEMIGKLGVAVPEVFRHRRP